jgi:hypothetical protein
MCTFPWREKKAGNVVMTLCHLLTNQRAGTLTPEDIETGLHAALHDALKLFCDASAENGSGAQWSPDLVQGFCDSPAHAKDWLAFLTDTQAS